MGAERRLYFDTPKTNTYFGDLQDSINEYEKFADEHLLDVDAIISTNSWQGVDADAAKTQLTDIEQNILKEIIQLQKDVNDVDGEIIDKFYTMVDDSTETFIDYNTIKKVNSDFIAQAATFNVKVKVAEAKISELSSKYSKYGEISTQDFSPGKTAFEEMCGGETGNSGYLNQCMKKLLMFDSDAKAYIEEQKIDKKIESLTKKMCMSVHFRHPEYGLGHYVDDIEKFENEYSEIKIKTILHRDVKTWSVEDIRTVSQAYYNAVCNRDWHTVQTILQELKVEECIKEYKTREKDGELCDKYSSYLDPYKSYLILSFIYGDGYGDTDAFSVLEEMASMRMDYVIPRGAYSTKPNITIGVTSKDYGLAVYWGAYRGGETLGLYERVIFNQNGLTPKQKYDLTKNDSTLNQYSLQLKTIKDGLRLSELENKYKSDKKYTDVVFDKKQNTKNDDRAYKFINDKSSRLGIRMITFQYDEDCMDYLNEDEIKTYNYLYYEDSKKDTALADEYLELLIPLLRQRKAKKEYDKMSNGKGCDGLEKALFEVYVGFDNIRTGIRNFINLDDDCDGIARYSVTEYADQLIMSNASEGEALGYKVCKTVGAMAPGTALTLASGGAGVPVFIPMAGNALMYGTGAGGNAKAWAERSGFTQEQAKNYGEMIAVEEALKVIMYTYLATPNGNMFANASLPARMLGTGMTTFTIEFIDEVGVKPGMAYIFLNDKDAYNNINWKEVFENCSMAGVTVVVVHGLGEFRAYRNARSVVAEEVNSLLPGNEEFIGPLEEADNHLIYGEGIGPKKRGVLGGHNKESFYNSLESTGYQLDDLLVGEPIEHPEIEGIYAQKYRVPKYDGRNNFIGYKDIPEPKTYYDPNIISNEQMIKWGHEAIENGTFDGRSFSGVASNGLEFKGYIQTDGTVRYYPYFER